MTLIDFIFMVVNFVILMGALIYFAGKSVKAKFKGRIDKIQTDLEDSAQAGTNAQEFTASAQQCDSRAEEKRKEIFDKANEVIAKNRADAARKCPEEKKDILQDAEDVKKRMEARMRLDVYSGAVDRLTDSLDSFLRNDKFADAKMKLQSKFVSAIDPLLKPTRSDVVKMGSGSPLDVVVSGSQEVGQDYIDKLHGMIVSRFIDCNYNTDPELGDEIQVEYGGKLYHGKFDDLISDIESDDQDNMEALHDMIVKGFIDCHYNTDPELGDNIQVECGGRLYNGTFDEVLELIGTDMA